MEDLEQRRAGAKFFYGWIVIILALFAVAVTNGLSIGGIPVFYRSFIKEFGWDRTTIATAGALLLLALGLAGPFTGQLWDRYGPKLFMVIGAAIIGLSLIVGSFINAPLHLYLMVLLMAVGLTFAGLGPGLFLASSWFTAKRGIAMGIVAMGTSLGGMIFLPLSNSLITVYGWRVAMRIYAVFSFAVFVPLMYFFVKNRPSEVDAAADPDEMDWFLRNRKLVNSVLATAAIVGTVVYSPVSDLLIAHTGRRGAILIFVLLGVICLVLTARYMGAGDEKPAPAPRVETASPAGATLGEAASSVSFWMLVFGSSLCYYVIFATVQHFILHLQSPEVGFSPAAAAWAYSTMFFFGLVGKSVFGFLSDRLSKLTVNLAGFAMLVAGTLILLRIDQANAWFFCLFFGLGYGGITVTTKMVLVELFGMRSLGKLLGIMMSAETLFGSGGNLLTGRLFDSTSSYHTAFRVMAVCSIVAVLLMAMLYRSSNASLVKSDDALRVTS